MFNFDFPYLLLGETFFYPDLLLQNFFGKTSSNPDSISLYYDIMCRYRPHLESRGVLPEEILQKCKYLIGQFHVLPHGGKCIREMQPYTTKGNGKVDGEALERRWATFRLHMNSFKQMSPSNRTVFMERIIWYAQ